MLIDLIEGVEDIPHPVGLPWTWQTYPQYLDFLASRRHDMDICAYVPHAPVRVYVTGQRGAVVYRDGLPTGVLPGRLVRGPQGAVA
jgi:N-acyl-D-aspartate/D-glutamate deacylase